jgi:hypothetical protein
MPALMRESLPSASVRRLPSASGLLLLDTSSNRIFAYNDPARLVWEGLSYGLSDVQIAHEFASAYGVAREIGHRDMQTIISEWDVLGLIARGGAGRLPDERSAPKVDGAWARESVLRWAVTFTCTIRNRVFAFAIESSRDVGIRDWFQYFETPHAPPDMRLEVRDANGESALVVEGKEYMRADTPRVLVAALYQVILDAVHPDVSWLAMIHGGAIVRGDTGLIMPAPSGSGKTTLIAYLIARGYLCLADDLILLSEPDGLVVAWPLPLNLKAGSWPLLSETYPNLLSFPVYSTSRGDIRQIVPSPQVWDRDPARVKCVVFPRLVPGTKAKLAPVTQFDAVVRLLRDRIWLGYPMTEQRVRRFLTWLNDKAIYELAHGDLADAALCLEQIM